MKELTQDDAIGIWHETYLVEPENSNVSTATCRFSGSPRRPPPYPRKDASRRRRTVSPP